jgi:formamidopyrimidine-DNA glycosylase
MMPEGPEVKTLVDQLQPAVGMRLVDLRFVSGRYVRHGRPTGFEEFARTMTPVGTAGIKEATEQKNYVRGANNGDGGNVGRASAVTRDDDDENGNDAIDIITTLKCKGKFIYLTLDQGKSVSTSNGVSEDYLRSIWITLGMTGRFVNEDQINATTSNDEGSSPRWYIELMDLTTHRRRRIYYRDARNFGTLRFVLSEKELNEKLDSLGADLMDDSTTEDVFLQIMDKSVQSRNICKFLMDQGKIAGVG